MNERVAYRIEIEGPKSARERFIHQLRKNMQQADTHGLEISMEPWKSLHSEDYPGFKTARNDESEP